MIYHDLDEKSITVTKTLDYSVLEIKLCKNQEVGYLALESFLLKLSTVTKGVFQQQATINRLQFSNFLKFKDRRYKFIQ